MANVQPDQQGRQEGNGDPNAQVPQGAGISSTSLSDAPSSPGPTAAPGTLGATNTPPVATGGSSPATESPNNGSGSLPTGGAVGLAIGLLVLGLIIGAFAAFVVFRRRRSKQHIESAPISATAVGTQPPAQKPSEGLRLNQFLLDSTPEREIVSELSAIRGLLETHVDANYHLQPVQADASSLTQVLTGLGVGQQGQLSPAEAVSLALNPQTRRLALQHILSEVLFNSADLHGQSPISTLPAPIASFVRSIPPLEVKTGDSEGKSTTDRLNNYRIWTLTIIFPEATSLALTKWRTLSAFLLHPTRSDRSPLNPDGADSSSQISALAAALNAFLEPFVNPDPASRFQQTEHLQAVIHEVTKLGYVILSQPSEWRFVHRLDQKSFGTSFVVAPGLIKVSGRDGKAYQSPKTVVAPLVAQP